MRLVLFQPDIPQNLGASIRTAACFGAGVDVVEPCAFPLTDKGIRRAAMDYADRAEVLRHPSWSAFEKSSERASGRLVLFTTSGASDLWDVDFQESDLLLFGRESAGAPEEVRAAADLRVRIPLVPGVRSLNVAVACGIGLAAARRSAAVAAAREDGSCSAASNASDDDRS